ncbi:MAG: hypothetical protein JWM44_1320 [Bacilli bacterium]|nr:hypothetical protein [Bacilli bacterium]
MLTIYNRKKVKVALLPTTGQNTQASEVTKTRRLNSDYQLTFMIPMIFDNYKELELEGLIECEGQNYIIKDIKRNRQGLGINALITCKHIMNRLLDIKIPYESAIDESFGADISSLTNIITAATGGVFTFQIMDVFPLKDVYKWGSSNCLKAFQDLVTLYKVEFIPDNYNIKLYNKININNGMQYRIKKNIVEDSYETNTSAICTRITGLAKDSLTIINLPSSYLTADELSRLNAIPGAIVSGIIKVPYLVSQYAAAWSTPDNAYFDSEFEATDIDASDEAGKVLLLEEMRKKLAASEIPDIQISMNAADLWKIDTEEIRPQLGETVYLIDRDLEIDNIQARVMEITEYPFAPDKHTQVTLANFLLRDTNSIIADLHASKDTLDGLLTNKSLNTSRFEASARQALIDINNSKTELIYPPEGGILAQDKNNHLNQVRLTAAGLGISTDGWNTVDAAITANGIAAKVIVGILGDLVQLRANQIVVGDSGEQITDDLLASAANWNGKTTLITSQGVYTGTVQANQVIANSLSAISANLGTITAGTVTGATIETAIAGQRVIMDILGLRTFDSNSKQRISISTSGNYGVSGIDFNDENGNYRGSMFSLASSGLRILSQGDMLIFASGGTLYLRDLIDFTGAVLSGFGTDKVGGLDTALAGKATKNASTSTFTQPNHDHGIDAGTQLMTVGGGYVTWVPSGGFSHSHTQT